MAVPKDDQCLIGKQQLALLSKANDNKQIIDDLVAELKEREPDFISWVKQKARIHYRVHLQNETNTRTAAAKSENIVLKFATLAYYAVRESMRTNDLSDLESRMDGKKES